MNQKRVSFRQTEAVQKEKLKLQKTLLLEQEEQQRESRLERLRAQASVGVC